MGARYENRTENDAVKPMNTADEPIDESPYVNDYDEDQENTTTNDN
jgi:hypothetical protein